MSVGKRAVPIAMIGTGSRFQAVAGLGPGMSEMGETIGCQLLRRR